MSDALGNVQLVLPLRYWVYALAGQAAGVTGY